MGIIDSLETTSSDAVKSGEYFLETSKSYLELRAFKQIALGAVTLSKLIVIGSFVFLALLFFTVALAHYLGELLGSLVQGFVATGGILVLFAVIAYALRKILERRVIQKLSSTFFDDL